MKSLATAFAFALISGSAAQAMTIAPQPPAPYTPSSPITDVPMADKAASVFLFVNACDVKTDMQHSAVFEIGFSKQFMATGQEAQKKAIGDIHASLARTISIPESIRATLNAVMGMTMEKLIKNNIQSLKASFAFEGRPVDIKPQSYVIEFTRCRNINSLRGFAYTAVEARRQKVMPVAPRHFL